LGSDLRSDPNFDDRLTKIRAEQCSALRSQKRILCQKNSLVIPATPI
jgi:hypothetical protein